MAVNTRFIVAAILVLFIPDVNSKTLENGGELFESLLARIEALEASDVANNAKIAEMESDFKVKLSANELDIVELKTQMSELEARFQVREAALLQQISILETTVERSNGKPDIKQELRGGNEDDTKRPRSESNRIRRKLQLREAPETEVAFYVTHADHDVHHLGHNQILQFPVAITNIGNAYNNSTGGFRAPVDGTYVIHATVMGMDIATTGGHMHAYFDVSGTLYSRFYVTAYDQSSQMLVIELKAGQTVTVRNDYTDVGFVGQHYTTFSGFLLYQHFPSGAVIGK